MNIGYNIVQDMGTTQNGIHTEQTTLYLFIKEDVLNNPEFSADISLKLENSGTAMQTLVEECKKIVREFKSVLTPKKGIVENGGVKTMILLPEICFDFKNVPAITAQEPNSLHNFLLLLATQLATEISGKERVSKRKPFVQPDAPHFSLNAAEADASIQIEIGRNCWGCQGLGVYVDPKYEVKHDSCPL